MHEDEYIPVNAPTDNVCGMSTVFRTLPELTLWVLFCQILALKVYQYKVPR